MLSSMPQGRTKSSLALGCRQMSVQARTPRACNSSNALFKSTIGFWMVEKSRSLKFLKACSQSNAGYRSTSGNSSLEGCGRAKSPKMWYSLTDFSVLKIVTERLRLIFNLLVSRAFQGRKRSFDRQCLLWYTAFLVLSLLCPCRKGIRSLLGWRNDVPSSALLTCLKGKLYCCHRTTFLHLPLANSQ